MSEINGPASASKGARLGRRAWKWFRWSLVPLSLLIALVHFIEFFPDHWQRDDPHRDVHWLFLHAERIRTRETLYWPWPEYGPDVMTGDKPYPHDRQPYPPFLGAVLSWFSGIGYERFARLWYLPVYASLWIYAATVARLAVGRITPSGVLIAWLILIMLPRSHAMLSLGNVDPLLWAAFGIALVSRPLRGAGMAASALVKIYCIWPLLYVMYRERQSAIPSAGAVLFAGLGAATLTLGPVGLLSALVDWLRYMLPVAGQGTFNEQNYSLSMLGLRVARMLGWEYSGGPLPLSARSYLVVASVLGPLVAGILARRRSAVTQYACIGAAASLFSPLCWSLAPVLAPLAALIGEGRVLGSPSSAPASEGKLAPLLVGRARASS